VKTFGEAPISWTDRAGAAIPGTPLAIGKSANGCYAISCRDFYEYNASPNNAIGRSAYTWMRKAGNWTESADATRRIPFIEAPRSRLVFSNATRTYTFPSLVDLGSGVYVAAAQFKSPIGKAWLELALISGSDAMRVSLRADYEPGLMTAGHETWMVAAGPYLVLYTGPSTISVLTFNPVTLAVSVLKTLGASVACGPGPNLSLDASLSPDGTALWIVSADGSFAVLNTSTWNVNSAATITIPAVQAGTIGVCSTSATDATFVYLNNLSSLWVANRIAGGVWTSETIHTMFAIPAAASKYTRRACVSNMGGLRVCAGVYDDLDMTYPGVVSGVSIIVNGTAVNSTSYLDGSLFATKPLNTGGVNDDPVIWSYQSSNWSNRSALLMADLSGGGTLTAATQLFRGGDPAPAPASDVTQSPGPMISSAYLPPEINGVKRSGYLALLVTQKDAFDTRTNVWLSMAADGYANRATDNPIDAFQPAMARGETVISGGYPFTVRGEFGPSGFGYCPPTPRLTNVGAGALAAGTYVYVLVKKYISESGDIVWSAVSDPVSITLASASRVGVDAVDSFAVKLLGRSVIEAYRTVNAGTVFYRVGSFLPGLTAAGTTDEMTDAVASTQPILYTQGERSGIGGMLEHYGAPPCRSICSGSDRMLAGGLSNETLVQFSNLFFPGEAISWPQNAAFQVEVDEPVTAVACLDGTWIVFSADGIWAITGPGPDAMGNGSFDEPRRISSGIGAVSWRSVVEFTGGLAFQARNGQIYVIQRGSLAVDWLSRPIREAIQSATATADGDKRQANRVIGSTYDADTQCVVFAMQKGAISWCYSEVTGAWHQQITTTRSGNCSWVGSVSLVDAGGYNGPAIVFGADGQLERCRRPNDSAQMVGFSGSSRTMTIETSDIDLDGGRIRRGWVTLQQERSIITADATNTATVAWSFDGLNHQTTPDESVAIVGDGTGDTTVRNFEELEVAPARQRCNQFRMRLQLAPAAGYYEARWNIVGLAFDVESKARKTRYALGSTRG